MDIFTFAANFLQLFSLVYKHRIQDTGPSKSRVAAQGLSSEGGGQDPWGNPYEISCSGDDIQVASNGPDRQAGTDSCCAENKAAATDTML